jgi:hypothetical protein
VKLAILSLRQCCPALSIVVSCPSAPPSFIEWLSRIPRVTLAQYPETQNCLWNAKPTVLLRLLKEGYPEVIWVDSDIIAHRDVLTPLTELSARSFGATQETYYGHMQGGTARTIAWGLKPGREMPCTVNSGVLRVTPEHVELLTAWEQLLGHPLYRRAQALQWFRRPLHMLSDQEVLTGLLGAQEFSGIPLVLLRRGIDIAQCMGPSGFTPRERITALHKGLPGLIHSMGSKPWMKAPQPPPFELSAPSLRRYYDYLHLELTPYVSVARRYAQYLDEDLQWMESSSRAARFMAAATLSTPTLQEFPLSLIDATGRTSRRWLKIARFSLHEEFCLHESPFRPTTINKKYLATSL